MGLSSLNVILISLTVSVTLIAILAIALLFYFKRSHTKEDVISPSDVNYFIYGNLSKNKNSSETPIDTAVNAPYDVSLEIPKDNIKIDRNTILGNGEFSTVFKALVEWEGGLLEQVALKVSKDNCRPTALKGFLSEIKVMSYIGKHPNIIALKGAYTAELTKGVVYVATELCDLGTLEKYLRKKGKLDGENTKAVVVPGMNSVEGQEMELTSPASNISMLDMVRWSYEIASGMKYLEGKHIVHADLATRNIILSSEKVAKITDFGISRRMQNYANYVKTQQEPPPWRWMSIEVLKQLDFSSKSDVWSYGITLWEIFSEGDIPYPGASWGQSFVNELANGLRPACPLFATPEIYNIMRDCWNFDVIERPSFSNLVDLTLNELDKCRSVAGNGVLYTKVRSGDLR